MFIVKYYVLVSVATFIIALITSYASVSIMMIWTGLSFAVVSASYLTNKPWIFRKREDGTIPYVIKVVLLPYFLGAQLYNLVARKRDTVPNLQRISEHLYLGCRLFPSDIDTLKEHEIGAIIDATAEFDGLGVLSDLQDIAYLNVPILDHCAPRIEELQRAIVFIYKQVQNGTNVVVHCALGRGR
jgi:hypothetical protein